MPTEAPDDDVALMLLQLNAQATKLAPTTTQYARHFPAGARLQQLALVDDVALALLQLRAQAAQLALVAPQQRALVQVLVHARRIAHRLGALRKLGRAQRLCART